MAMFVREEPCDICDTVEDVNSFCLTCKQKFCDNCKKGHLRSAFAKHHKFVPIGDSLLASLRKDDLCSKHNDENQFYFKTCSKTCCPVCLSLYHRNHDFSPISKLTEEIRNEIEEKLSLKEKDVSGVADALKKYASASQDCSKQSDEIISYIKKTILGWVTELKSFEDELIEETKAAAEVKRTIIETKAKELQSTKETCTKEIQDVRVLLRTCSDASLLDQKGSIMSRIDYIVVPSADADPVLPTITLRQSSRQEIRQILRNVRTDNGGDRSDSISKQLEEDVAAKRQKPKLLKEVKIIHEFHVGESVCDIASVSESKAWIGTSGNVMLVDTDGEILLHYPHGNTWSLYGGTSVTSTSSGDALYVSNDSVINRIDQTGQVSEVVDLETYIYCIRSSDLSNCIYAATNECILRLSHDGTVQARMECSAYALTELTDGRLVAIDINQNFVLVNTNVYFSVDMGVAVECNVGIYITPLSSDSWDRIIILGNPVGNQLRVYEIIEGAMYLLNEQTVHTNIDVFLEAWGTGGGKYAVTTTSDGRVWIGTENGVVITAEYQE